MWFDIPFGSWLFVLQLVDVAIVIAGAATPGLRYVRLHLWKTSDPLTILNHLKYFPPLDRKYTRSKINLVLTTYLALLVVGTALVIINAYLIMPAILTGTQLPYYSFILILATNAVLLIMTYITYWIWPVFKRYRAHRAREEAEARIL